MNEYRDVKKSLAVGWNTWNTRSVLSHVLLPEAFALNLGIKEYSSGACLREALIGRMGKGDEQIVPGPHSYDGSYTELTLEWRNVKLKIRSATTAEQELAVLVSPQSEHDRPPLLVVESGMLWNRPGTLVRNGESLVGLLPTREIHVYASCPGVHEPQVEAQTPYLALPLDREIALSTGRKRSVADVEAIVAGSARRQESAGARFGELAEIHAAMQTCMAWDTIYDPTKERVISPVSRIWNCGSGGYVLFCWDTYFAAYLAAADSKELAYANAIEITREMTKDGFVPNYCKPTGFVSFDRSQPPVGSLVVSALYRSFGDRWLIEELFDSLLMWNRWWPANRDTDGFLCWGSNPIKGVDGKELECNGVYDRQGAAFESGLDNSPMYDDIPFDKSTCQMCLADVGLMGLYVADCAALAAIAEALGRNREHKELAERAERYRSALRSLWNEEFGLFLNRRTDTGTLERRISPTNFYALLGGAASQAQAERMTREHFYNPAEFWGDWIMPSIARNDPGYPDQDYWRGRIWAPMNFLVYLGMRNYDLPDARLDLVRKSAELLLKEWREHGHVHENYCGDTGQGCGKWNSDRFYHWGGLLGLISLIEAGYVQPPVGIKPVH